MSLRMSDILSFVQSMIHDLPDSCAAPAIMVPIRENEERLGESFDIYYSEPEFVF